LYDAYAHSKIDRRQFVEKLSTYAVGGPTVSSLMAFIMPNYMDNIQVKVDDPRLETKFIEYNSPREGGKIKGQLSQPTGNNKKLPGIVVIHENIYPESLFVCISTIDNQHTTGDWLSQLPELSMPIFSLTCILILSFLVDYFPSIEIF